MKYLPKTLIEKSAPLLSRRQLRRQLAETHNATPPVPDLRFGRTFHNGRCQCAKCQAMRALVAQTLAAPESAPETQPEAAHG